MHCSMLTKAFSMVKIFILLITLLFSSISVLSAETFEEISIRFYDSYDKWLNSEIETPDLISKMSVLDSFLIKEPHEWNKYYWRSRIAIVRGHIHFEREEKEQSIEFMEKSIALTNQSLRLNNFSDSWRLLADAGSYLMMQKGMVYIIKNSKKVQENAKTALKLDSTNARASLVVAQYLIGAPRIAGGNWNEGLEIMRALSKRDDLNRDDKLAVQMSLADAYKKKKQKENTIKAYEGALKIFPNNRRVNMMLEELKGE